jgi:hypothetical protein
LGFRPIFDDVLGAEMEFENEYWKLVITPRYVRKDSSKIKVDCVNCKGSGLIDNPDAMGLMDHNMKCFYCWGDGKREVLPEIPPPPEIDHKFLEDLKEWFQNYEV